MRILSHVYTMCHTMRVHVYTLYDIGCTFVRRNETFAVAIPEYLCMPTKDSEARISNFVWLYLYTCSSEFHNRNRTRDDTAVCMYHRTTQPHKHTDVPLNAKLVDADAVARFSVVMNATNGSISSSIADVQTFEIGGAYSGGVSSAV